ncbi:hypothetical protein IWX90DRAFT_100311 [Phyllosticta citrichinensis]|uniref:Uncharacterized protein n=1 Tax=Phyllosticta citrichinensis TaxID=1130410 RepID=A0ABR1Y2B5_9PEZI
MSPAVAWYRSFGAAHAAVSSVALRSSRAGGRSSLFVCSVFHHDRPICGIFTPIAAAAAAAANDSILALAIRDSDGVATGGQQSRNRLDSTQGQRGPTSARWHLSSSIARVCYAERARPGSEQALVVFRRPSLICSRLLIFLLRPLPSSPGPWQWQWRSGRSVASVADASGGAAVISSAPSSPLPLELDRGWLAGRARHLTIRALPSTSTRECGVGCMELWCIRSLFGKASGLPDAFAAHSGKTIETRVRWDMRSAVIAHHRGAILVVVVWCRRLAEAICQSVNSSVWVPAPLALRMAEQRPEPSDDDDDNDALLTIRNLLIAQTPRKTAQQNISPLPQSFPTPTLALVFRSPGLAASCQSCPPQGQGPPAPLVRSIRSRWSLAPTLFPARTVGDYA